MTAANIDTYSTSSSSTNSTTCQSLNAEIIQYGSTMSGCTGYSTQGSGILSISITDSTGAVQSINNTAYHISFNQPVDGSLSQYNNTQNSIIPNTVNTTDSNNSALCPTDTNKNTTTNTTTYVYVPPSYECIYYDPVTQQNSSSGCSSSAVFTLLLNGVNQSYIRCTCTHLTEFGVLFHQAQVEAITQTEQQSPHYNSSACIYTNTVYTTIPPDTIFGNIANVIWCTMYCCVGLCSTIQLYRVVIPNYIRLYTLFQTHQLLLCEHVLICILCVVRAVICMIYYNLYSNISVAAFALISALPHCLNSWLFSLVIFAWAAIYHTHTAAMQRHAVIAKLRQGQLKSTQNRVAEPLNPFVKFRIYFIISNILIVCIMLLCTIPIATNTVSYSIQEILAECAEGISGSLALICVIFFVSYGTALVRALTTDQFHSTHAAKLYHTALAVSMAFAGQSIVLLYTVIKPDVFTDNMFNFDIINGIYSTCDCAGLAAILYLFRKQVTDVCNQGHKVKPRESRNNRSTLRAPTTNRQTTVDKAFDVTSTASARRSNDNRFTLTDLSYLPRHTYEPLYEMAEYQQEQEYSTINDIGSYDSEFINDIVPLPLHTSYQHYKLPQYIDHSTTNDVQPPSSTNKNSFLSYARGLMQWNNLSHPEQQQLHDITISRPVSATTTQSHSLPWNATQTTTTPSPDTVNTPLPSYALSTTLSIPSQQQLDATSNQNRYSHTISDIDVSIPATPLKQYSDRAIEWRNAEDTITG